MVGGGARSKIEWGAISLAFNLVSALILVAVAYGLFHGSTDSKIAALERDINRVEERLERHLERVGERR